MKRIHLFPFLLFTALCCFVSSCSSDDNSTPAPDPNAMTAAEVKSAVAASEESFYSMFNASDFAEIDTLKNYFNAHYADYTRYNSNVLPMKTLLNTVVGLVGGDLTSITALLDSINVMQGDYSSSTTKKWNKVGFTSNALSFRFTDAGGQDCTAKVAWKFSTSAKDSIVLADANHVVKLRVPKEVSYELMHGTNILVSGSSMFTYNAATNILQNASSINVCNKYFLSGLLQIANDTLSSSLVLTNLDNMLAKWTMTETGHNILTHIYDNTASYSLTKVTHQIDLNKGVTLKFSFANPLIFRAQALSAIIQKDYSSTNLNNIANLLNTNLTKELYVNGKQAANFTVVVRDQPTIPMLTGYLDAKVNFMDNTSCALNELFTHNERAKADAFIMSSQGALQQLLLLTGGQSSKSFSSAVPSFLLLLK